MRNFSEWFMEHPGESLQYMGLQVQDCIEIPIYEDSKVNIEILRFNRKPKQYVSLASFESKLKFLDGPCKVAHISAGSKPNPFGFEFQGVKKSAFLRLWNSWDYRGNVEHGLGNAGVIVVEKKDSMHGSESILVQCSDGQGKPDFRSLVLRLDHYSDRLSRSDSGS